MLLKSLRASTIYDLYHELIQTLRGTHRFISIQFPCTVPPLIETVELEEDNQNPLHTKRRPEWKDLVGYSGYQYDPSLTIEDLRKCWPHQEDDSFQPIQVVAIPKDLVENLPYLAAETEEQLNSRVHLMGSMYDLFYANPVNRVITLPIVDSWIEKQRKVWIRSYWEEFKIGVITRIVLTGIQVFIHYHPFWDNLFKYSCKHGEHDDHQEEEEADNCTVENEVEVADYADEEHILGDQGKDGASEEIIEDEEQVDEQNQQEADFDDKIYGHNVEHEVEDENVADEYEQAEDDED
ncbi:hypothetical protein BLNAU_10409 [Blattamonas nauphoetae]|uniref:Uncharacterized protein n=1 Tax=Blattamonas nauphoetae TaxID=2049346 RepID=A0ABQ9XS92_9EUKA|nr:hypothetical protein BLNAU_10409 [Blattamonas nauphoetae]